MYITTRDARYSIETNRYVKYRNLQKNEPGKTCSRIKGYISSVVLRTNGISTHLLVPLSTMPIIHSDLLLLPLGLQI